MKSILFTLALLTTQAYAHEDHNHEAAVETAPHGGILRNSPPFKTELVLVKDLAKIYVYDKTVTPVSPSKLKGTATGQLALPKDKKKSEVVFKLVGDSYQATIPRIDKVHRYDLHVTIEIEGKAVLADFGVDNIN